MSAEAACPPGYMQDHQGRLVPESIVSDIDKLRDQTVRQIVEQAQGLSAILAKFKLAAFSDIAAFVQTSAEQYEVKVGGAKGNLTLYSFDGRYKLVRQIQETIRFDERLQAAKKLVDECITDWSEGSRDELMVLVNDAFKVDKEGAVSVTRVLGLRRHRITDPKWQRAMQAVADAVHVVGSRSYVRVYERVGTTDAYRAIPLDIAGV